ncbi:MAG: hypothetical protein L0J57_00140 [Brachybacterium sp.]|nr:hypothetical protein [Kocuria sp.]MDN5661871.1 hypothetical protein [Brevibacterium aurantiacum]MDN6301447.1 hypothetical protein [Brachybacterium sp.]
MPDIPILWDYFPFMPQVQNLAGGVMAVVLVACVIAFVIAAVVFAFAKISSSSGMSQTTVSVMFVVLIAAAAVGAAVGLIGWASGALVW